MLAPQLPGRLQGRPNCDWPVGERSRYPAAGSVVIDAADRRGLLAKLSPGRGWKPAGPCSILLSVRSDCARMWALAGYTSLIRKR